MRRLERGQKHCDFGKCGLGTCVIATAKQQDEVIGGFNQRSMLAIFASSWRSPEAGVRLFKRSS
jgi:hypothetical protein